MIKVESTWLDSYKIEDKILFIKFHKGGTYKYENVEEGILEEFEKSESKSSYFRGNIKSKHKGVKVDE